MKANIGSVADLQSFIPHHAGHLAKMPHICKSIRPGFDALVVNSNFLHGEKRGLGAGRAIGICFTYNQTGIRH